jgi:hypothetical protein
LPSSNHCSSRTWVPVSNQKGPRGLP